MENLIQKIKSLLLAIPASTPVVGASYSSYMTTEQINALEELIKQLSDDQMQSLLRMEARHSQMLTEIRIDASRNSMPRLEKMDVVIPCGGQGGSLFPMTQVMPKCLVMIKNKSILQHIIDVYFQNRDKFRRVIVTTGDYHEAISCNASQGGFGDFVECVHVGSMHVSATLLHLNDRLSNRFVMHYNDILIPQITWNRIIERYDSDYRHLKQMGMLITSRNYPLKVGVVIEQNGIITSFTEKPKTLGGDKAVNTAVAIVEKIVVEKYCKDDKTPFYEDTIGKILQDKENICSYHVDQWFHVQDWNALWDIQHGVVRPFN
jgi:NDP-sugar pyrophosphorylase family protein